MDPTKTEPIQPGNSDIASTGTQISASPLGVERGPVTPVPEAQKIAEVKEYLKSSNPEPNPDSEVSQVIQVNPVAQPQRTIDEAVKPTDQLQNAIADLPAAQAAAQGETSSSNTWIGKVRQFVDERIISIFKASKPLKT